MSGPHAVASLSPCHPVTLSPCHRRNAGEQFLDLLGQGVPAEPGFQFLPAGLPRPWPVIRVQPDRHQGDVVLQALGAQPLDHLVAQLGQRTVRELGERRAQPRDAVVQRQVAALDEFERNVMLGDDTVEADFRFHLQIAQATGNPYFADILSHLGRTIIPRTRIKAIRDHVRGGAYLSRVNREHEEIHAAIARRDAESARAAMRIHLTNSRERLRLSQQAAQTADAADPDAATTSGRSD